MALPVSIIKPLYRSTSIEGLAEALESFFQLDYDANIEIIFLTDDLNCDAIKVAMVSVQYFTFAI